MFTGLLITIFFVTVFVVGLALFGRALSEVMAHSDPYPS